MAEHINTDFKEARKWKGKKRKVKQKNILLHKGVKNYTFFFFYGIVNRCIVVFDTWHTAV